LHTQASTLTSTFVIASGAHVEALRKRLSHDPTAIVFSEAESLVALRAMLSRPPSVLVLDAEVARTARGALIVSQLQEQSIDVRVLAHDSSGTPLLLSQPDAPLHAVSHPIEDGGGTRTARRFPMTDQEAVIDGSRSQLVNLSTSGAQVIVAARMQPNQSVRFILYDDHGHVRFNGQVAWASIEMILSAVQYRAGIAFTNPDKKFLEKFCKRHGRS
jgi:PilZ domain-containing protein